MHIEKKGRIFCPDGSLDWMNNSVLTPQPILLSSEIIRIYASFRDQLGRGRIGYIDVQAENPSVIINISQSPVLDVGEKGMFDDNGVILGDVIWVGNQIFMYYVGFQLVQHIKFLAYSGLAISDDGGNSFRRLSSVPVMDRAENAKFFRAIHTVLPENDIFRIWYAVGSGWQIINGVPYPQYDIRYTESPNGMFFPDSKGLHCIGTANNEYRIGRPKVVRKSSNKLAMRYTFDTLDKEYISGYAESMDGINWARMDDYSALTRSASGWDSEMACYPVEIKVGNAAYLFYSGNGMGREGLGYAEITE